MLSKEKANAYGSRLIELLRLQSSPVAVRMLEKESDLPEDSLRPVQDTGKHYAQCQAFSLSRRDRRTVAMMKADNWCPAPVMAYGLVPPPDDPAAKQGNPYQSFEYGRYIGILTAPLETAKFDPDVVVIYSDTNQLRSMLLSLKEADRSLVKSNFFPFSCAYAVTSPILNNEYWINLPDPGEYVRALTQAGEMIFSIPAKRLEEFMDNLETFFAESMMANEQMMMLSDFPQPDIYKEIFKKWNL